MKSTFQADALMFVDIVRQRHVELPFVLVGQSFGGGLIMRIAKNVSDIPMFKGMFFLSPMVEKIDLFVPNVVCISII